MAIITPGANISDIRGSIAGTNFKRSTQGISMTNKVIRKKNNSQSQNNIQQINSQLNYAWSALTDAQRNNWAQFSNFVNSIGLTKNGKKSSNTGKMQFLAVNFYCLLYKKNIIITPTFTDPVPPVIPCPPDFISSTTLMNYTGTIDNATQLLITKISLPQSNTTKTTNTGYRTLIYEQVSGDVQDWSTSYYNQYGLNLMPGRAYWVSLQVLNFITGIFSPVSQQLIKYLPVVSSAIGTAVIGTSIIS
ncbi:MAG: hypothetical protein V4547_16180 [Bacteroidota bacterium]